jgi:hypothetical protein
MRNLSVDRRSGVTRFFWRSENQEAGQSHRIRNELLGIFPREISIRGVPKDQEARVIKYETAVVTLIGVCALFVSGYTAYIQRQQVRATVWPILEYDTSNDPMIRLTVENKGVGPAIIRHVVVRVDGEPVRNWEEAMTKLLGPLPQGRDHYRFSESTMNGHVLKPGESIDVLVPHDFDGNPIKDEKSGEMWTRLNKDRQRVSVEICYCSTLGECWNLRAGANGNSTVEARGCPKESAITFQR